MARKKPRGRRAGRIIRTRGIRGIPRGSSRRRGYCDGFLCFPSVVAPSLCLFQWDGSSSGFRTNGRLRARTRRAVARRQRHLSSGRRRGAPGKAALRPSKDSPRKQTGDMNRGFECCSCSRVRVNFVYLSTSKPWVFFLGDSLVSARASRLAAWTLMAARLLVRQRCEDCSLFSEPT